MAPPSDVTRMLAELTGGDRAVLDDLMPIIYEELRRLAHRELAREAPGHTLSTTELVHEAYLKLARADSLTWKDRAHFFGVCAQAMRRVLVNHAVSRNRQKRGGAKVQLPIEDVVLAARERPDDLIAIDECLERLQAISERQCRVIECRFFARMSVEDTATALGIAPATVKRDWALARSWLHRELLA